jgi:hypothetical protein
MVMRSGSRTPAAPTAEAVSSDRLDSVSPGPSELLFTGIQAAHVGIDSSIGVSVIPGVEAAKPEQIAPLYWELHTTKRDEAELVFRLDAEGFPRA